MTCCICYEEKEFQYECYTCQEGKICFNCFHRKAQSYTFGIRKLSREEVLPILSCPCCRTINWKVLYTNLLIEIETNNLFETKHTYIKTNKMWWKEMESEAQSDWRFAFHRGGRHFRRMLLKILLKKELLKKVSVL